MKTANVCPWVGQVGGSMLIRLFAVWFSCETMIWAAPGCVASQPAGSVRWSGNGHYYALSSTPANFIATNAEAASRNGYLVSILSQEEQDFVWNQFKSQAGSLWIGFTDEAVEGTFQWTSGEPVSYTNWQAGEPNNEGGTENWGIMETFAPKNGRWLDGNFTDVIYGVIEFNPCIQVTVSPSSSALAAGQSLQFTAALTNTSNTAVTWSISPQIGTISATGLYTAPATLNSAQTITLTATSVADNTKSGTATLSLVICAYGISPPSNSFVSSGGSGTLTVTAPTPCAWTAVPSDGWVTIEGGLTGTGSGNVNYTAAASTLGATRMATITVAGQTHSITQTGRGCSAGLNPSRIDQSSAAATVNVALSMSASDCPWTAASSANWITISPTAGAGDATLRLTLAANTQTSGRSATVTIAGLTLTVTQAGPNCTLALSPASQTFLAAGGAGSVAVSSPVGCAYAVTSNAPFLIVSSGGGSRTSGGTVNFAVQANTSTTSRTASLQVGGVTFVVSQAGIYVPPLSCRVADVSNPPFLRATGRTELLADLDVTCTGRTGGATIAADFVLTLNVNATNRISSAITESTDAKLQIGNGGSISGRVEGLNAIRFPSVPIANGEPEANVTFRISQVRADTTNFGTPAQQSGVSVSGYLRALATVDLPLLNATQTLGVVRQGMVISRGSVRDGTSASQKIVPIIVQEAFPLNFRTRDGEGSSADTATRIRLAISNIPPSAQVYVSTSSVEGGAKLISANAEGIGGTQIPGSTRADGVYQQLTVSSGVATAFYEITNSSSTQLDSATVNLLFENANAGELNFVGLNASFAPFSDDSNASTTAPIPRFLKPGSSVRLVDLRISGVVQTGSRPVEMRAPVAIGGTATFTYRVANDSDERADGVTVRATLPQGVTNIVVQPAQGNCSTNGQQVRCNLGQLAASSQTSVAVVASVSGVSSCPNCVGNGTVLESSGTVGSTQADTDLANNSAQAGLEISDACRFTLSRAVLTAPGAASELKLDVATGPACDWTVAAQNGATLTPSGPLRGSVTLTVAVPANPGGAERTISLNIAGQTLTVVQAGSGCSATLTPPNSIPTAGGTLTVQVAAACSWKAVAGPDWVRIADPSTGQGAGSFSIVVQPNASIAPRVGFVEVMGRTLPIVQQAATSGCSYSLSDTQVSLAAGGGSGTVQVSAGAGCPWSAVTADGFLTITAGASGSGNGSVSFNASANSGAQRSGTITVAGIAVSVSQSGVQVAGPGLRFVSMAPCRVMETRSEYNFQGRTGTFGPPFLAAAETRTLAMPASTVCSIPASAKAYVVNVTLVPRGSVDFVTVWPAGEARPNVWTVRSPDGQVVANSAIVKAGANNGISVYASNPTDLIIDISGYFTDESSSALSYFPLTPCRAIDTRVQYRSPPGPFGPPTMNGGETRRFRFPSTPYCQIPAGAAAYSATITAVPPGALQYLTAWPAGGSQPNVSQINSPAGRILANSVILPVSSDGSVDVFVYDRTDVLVDITGYFAPDNGQGLLYFPVTQCRAHDSQFTDEQAKTVTMSACGAPASAKGYAANVTSISNGSAMPFLTLYPTGQSLPIASTLNAFEGQTVTNSTIVPSGTNAAIDVFAYRRTRVVVEISGYFGR